ncbi:MAG: hypothetical protein FWD23_05010 [Oscillospiraceae bacterium]|nr:hypothetical protein [Oscillospiraceae bacterium]
MIILDKKTKNLIAAIIILIITAVSVMSCSANQEDVYEQERFQFNNVFIARYVFEDKDYVYISSASEEENITRINKKTKDTEDLGIQGFQLTVYKNYLYYLDNRYGLYRIDLGQSGGEPELVHDEVELNSPNFYYIANDTVYLYPCYFPTYYIDINDISRKTEYRGGTSKYFIAGADEKYRYIITLKIENEKDIYTLARCLFKDIEFENKEDLFVINHPEWADLRFNNFLAVHDGFAYYCFNFAIYKCELKPGAESEIIYGVDEFGDDRFDVIAVTSDGIYITKMHIAYEPVYEHIYDKDYIYRLDFAGENETAVKYPPEPYFVGGGSKKLCYIKDNGVHEAE